LASIRKRKWITGSGEERIAFAVDFTDDNGSRQRRQFASKREADAFRVDIESQMRSGTYRADARRVTVKEVADQFIAHCKGRCERHERMTKKNYLVYDGHIRNYICPNPQRGEDGTRSDRARPFRDGIGAIRLSQLTARTVGDLRDRLRDAGVSVPTTRKILGTLQQILAFAISRDYLAVNAASGVKVIGRRDEGSRKIVPPSKEAMRLLLSVADQDFQVQLLFASATGVRAGEMHALRWRHVDFETGEVVIETRVDAFGEEDVTKTSAGMRTIPLAAAVVLALKEWKLRTRRKTPEDLIFPSRRGWYVSHDNMVKRRFNPLFEKLAAAHAEAPDDHPKPPARFNWHALRHFAISCWIEAGLSPKTVQTFAGHSSLQVTMDRYGHLFPSDDHRQAMNRIADDMTRHRFGQER